MYSPFLYIPPHLFLSLPDCLLIFPSDSAALFSSFVLAVCWLCLPGWLPLALPRLDNVRLSESLAYSGWIVHRDLRLWFVVWLWLLALWMSIWWLDVWKTDEDRFLTLPFKITDLDWDFAVIACVSLMCVCILHSSGRLCGMKLWLESGNNPYFSVCDYMTVSDPSWVT